MWRSLAALARYHIGPQWPSGCGRRLIFCKIWCGWPGIASSSGCSPPPCGVPGERSSLSRPGVGSAKTRLLASTPTLPRHCERSEAIQGRKRRLDCFVASAPRNDGQTHLRIPATPFRPGFTNFVPPPKTSRAQGRPGARRTRGLVCNVHQRKTHTSIQVKRKQSGLPCAMALRLIRALPGESELLATIAPEEALASQGLDASNPGVRTTRLRRTRMLIRPRLRA